MTETEVLWIERVQEWEKSGLSAKQFAEGKPFMASTLLWRGRQLRRLGRLKGALPSRSSRSLGRSGKGRNGRIEVASRRLVPTSAPIAMAAVVRSSTPKFDAAVVVEVGGVRIQVGSGFDAALLKAVIRAVQGGV
jgi:hypothetical protein